MGKDETGTRCPGVDRKAVRAAQFRQTLAVEDVEGQPELGLKLVLPLQVMDGGSM